MMTDLTEPWEGSDVIFKVQKRPLYVNKDVLSMCSPVLKAMFSGDFKEKNADEIELPGKSYAAMKELFMLMQPLANYSIIIKVSNVEEILELSKEYQIDMLTQRCQEYLLTIDPSVRWLNVALEYDLFDLNTHCMKYIDNATFGKLAKQPAFEHMPPETKIEFLMKECRRYEPVVSIIKQIVSGDPENRTGTTWACPDDSIGKKHDKGSSKSCNTCVMFIIERIEAHVKNVAVCTNPHY